MDLSSTAVALTRDLIRRPSVTPADAGALDVLEQRLKAAGFTTHRLPFTEAGTMAMQLARTPRGWKIAALLCTAPVHAPHR